MPIERVVVNPFGFVKQASVPRGNELLENVKSGVLWKGKKIEPKSSWQIGVPNPKGNSVRITPYGVGIFRFGFMDLIRRGEVNVEVSLTMRQIKGRSHPSGKKVIYRHVPDKLNPFQKVLRALHR